MPVHADITATIGGTPLVHLARLAPDQRILAKIESRAPGGSVKDRVARAIVRAAEASEELRPGGTLVEGTSGNTGIGLAVVGAALGYHVVLAMPESMSVERRALLAHLGAELVLTPKADGMSGAVAAAERIAAERDGAVLARQFENQANVAAHREGTGPEILADASRVDILVAGVGTGGTITGAGGFLREHNPDLEIVAVEPAESPLLSEGTAGPHGIQGIGANFVPDILDRDLVDEVLAVATPDAIATAREFARTEGILAGISSGAAVHAARIVAARPENAGKTVVTVLPDTGERYLSTPLFEGTA